MEYVILQGIDDMLLSSGTVEDDNCSCIRAD